MKELIMKCGLFIGLLLALPWPAFASSSARGQHYEAALVVRTTSAKPGSQLHVAAIIRPNTGWHIYWKNPGETGYAPALNWSLPNRWSAGEVQHPAPRLLKLGGYASNVHDGETVLRQDIAVARDSAAGSTHRLVLDLDLLVCSDTSCVPDPLRLELDVPIGTGNPNPDAAEMFQRAEAALPKRSEGPVRYSADQEHVTLTFPNISVAKDETAHVFFETSDVIYEAGTQSFETSALVAAPPCRAKARSTLFAWTTITQAN